MRNLLFILFLSIITTAQAQTRLDNPELYIGVTLGSTASMVMFSPTIAQDYILGYNGGFVFRYIAEKNVGVQAELNFSQRGWSESTGLYSRQLNYIELPFLTHIYIGKKNRIFLNVGPKISYLLSEKVIVNNTLNSENQHTTLIQNPFDYGLCAGLGFMFNIKHNVYQLDTRASYSFNDVFANSKADYFAASKNLNLSVNLAWMLQIK
jgi:hypothetical protein